jgi:hypothetical protein
MPKRERRNPCAIMAMVNSYTVAGAATLFLLAIATGPSVALGSLRIMVDEKDFHVIEGGKSIEERAAVEKEFERFRRETLGDVDRKASIYSAGMVASTAFFQTVFGRDPTLERRSQSRNT